MAIDAHDPPPTTTAADGPDRPEVAVVPAIAAPVAAPIAAPVAARGRSRGATAFWLVATAIFALFLVAGSVTLEVGREAGRTRRVATVWQQLIDALPEVGHATLLRAVFYGAVAVVLLGSLLGLWLALTATDGPIVAAAPPPPPAEPA